MSMSRRHSMFRWKCLSFYLMYFFSLTENILRISAFVNQSKSNRRQISQSLRSALDEHEQRRATLEIDPSPISVGRTSPSMKSFETHLLRLLVAKIYRSFQRSRSNHFERNIAFPQLWPRKRKTSALARRFLSPDRSFGERRTSCPTMSFGNDPVLSNRTPVWRVFLVHRVRAFH